MITVASVEVEPVWKRKEMLEQTLAGMELAPASTPKAPSATGPVKVEILLVLRQWVQLETIRAKGSRLVIMPRVTLATLNVKESAHAVKKIAAIVKGAVQIE